MSWHELPGFCYMHNNVMNSLQNQWSGHVFELSLTFVILQGPFHPCAENTHEKHPLTCGLPDIVISITHAITNDSPM